MEEHLRLLPEPEQIQEALGRDKTNVCVFCVCEPNTETHHLLARQIRVRGEDEPDWLCGVASYMIFKKMLHLHFILKDYISLN